MTKVSKLMLSSVNGSNSGGASNILSSPKRRLYTNGTTTTTNSSIGCIGLVRSYLKILIYILIIIFFILQYLNILSSISMTSPSSTTTSSSLILLQDYIQRTASSSSLQSISSSSLQSISSSWNQQQRQDSVAQSDQHSSSSDSIQIHIVFSTGCNAFQDWQSYLFFHQIWKSGQRGNVTRVASGCKDDNEIQVLQNIFQKEIQYGIPTGNDRFHLHITPDYSKTLLSNTNYKFFNKPYGLLHWMEHALNMPYTMNEYKDTLFIIMDPDQFILRPFTSNKFNMHYSNDPTTTRDSTESIKVTPSIIRRYWHSVKKKTTNDNTNTNDYNENDFIVRNGYPMAQYYMFGSNFVQKVNQNVDRVVQAATTMMKSNIAFTETDINKKSNLYSWTTNDVEQYYVAGPPYIAMGYDMYRIVSVWAAIVVPVYELTVDHLSEMFAYSTAAAHLQLPHMLSYYFMISHPDAIKQEGWYNIDTMPKEQVCDNKYTIHDSTSHMNVEFREQYLPYVIHYCQRYYLGPYFFNKYRLPHNFLSCPHPLYLDPNEDDKIISSTSTSTSSKALTIIDMYDSAETPDHTKYNGLSMFERQRQGFFLCHVIGALNDAATYWKQLYCNNDHDNKDSEYLANYNKTYFVPPDPIKKKRRG